MGLGTSSKLVQPIQTQTTATPTQGNTTLPRNVLLLIIGELILLLVVACGAFYLGKQSQQQSNSALNAEIIPTPSISAPTPPINSGNSRLKWQSYTDSNYGYSLQYPPDWTLKQDKDAEGNTRIKLSSANATKAAFSSRMLPELYIAVSSPYSTSGSVCANQVCNETPSLEVKINNKDVTIPIIKGEVVQANNNKFDFYAFSYPLPGGKVSLPGYSEPIELMAFASYGTAEEAQVISTILSTLSLSSTTKPTSYAVPSTWKRTSMMNNSLTLCLPLKWEADQWGNIFFNRDPAYRPNVTFIQEIPYTSGSRREAYYKYWETEHPNVRELVSIKETSISSNTALTIYSANPSESKVSPDGNLAVVWYANGKLWKAGLSGWNMINDSESAFLHDFYTAISCSF